MAHSFRMKYYQIPNWAKTDSEEWWQNVDGQKFPYQTWTECNRPSYAITFDIFARFFCFVFIANTLYIFLCYSKTTCRTKFQGESNRMVVHRCYFNLFVVETMNAIYNNVRQRCWILIWHYNEKYAHCAWHVYWLNGWLKGNSAHWRRMRSRQRPKCENL